MATDKNYDFISFRIKKDTFETLKETKDAFEVFCDKKQTMDEFVQTLLVSLSKAEPEFWDVFETKKQMQILLQEKIASARAKRNGAVAPDISGSSNETAE